MNYPVWDVSFGAGLLIALVAVLHVFVSYFAVGGGLFLVLTERKARRNNDSALLTWLKSYTKFFVLVTVVFGAVSGVGIWFTIGLISLTATSNLIHAYVWGWGIEWVFFFVEITAASSTSTAGRSWNPGCMNGTDGSISRLGLSAWWSLTESSLSCLLPEGG